MTADDIFAETIAEAKQHDSLRSSSEQRYNFEVINRYHDFCRERGGATLPVSHDMAVAYLLRRAADGVVDPYLTTEMRNIELFHNVARQISVVRGLSAHHHSAVAQVAMNEFRRAIGFATLQLQRFGPAEIRELAPKTAFEMFPNGVVPKRFPDVAA